MKVIIEAGLTSRRASNLATFGYVLNNFLALTCDNNSVIFAKRRLSSFTYFVISCGHSNLWSTKFIQNISSNMNSHSEEEDRSDAKSLKQRENPRSLQLLTSTALVRSRATLTVFLNNNRKIQKKSCAYAKIMY